MIEPLRKTLIVIIISTASNSLSAKPSTPFPFNAYDGGVISAESLGRGRTIASLSSGLSAGSENPAHLIGDDVSALYTSVFVGQTSEVSSSIISQQEPLRGKTLQYLSIGSNKGVLFYEPLLRQDSSAMMDATSTREWEASGDAIGFAGAEKWGPGSIGLSLAYIRTNLVDTTRTVGISDNSEGDTGNGLRLNIGVQFTYQNFKSAFLIQNAPAFVWWKDYERDTLPLKIRAGQTYLMSNNATFSIDYETRYYEEGSRKQDYLYSGTELILSDSIKLRGGIFADDIQKKEDRHWTAGLSIALSSGAIITYAAERYEILTEKVTRSYISLTIPFFTEEN